MNVFFVWYMQSPKVMTATWKTESCQWANMTDTLGVFSPSPTMRCNIPGSTFGTMELVILICHSSVAFKKCPKKFKVIFCKIIQSKATGILNLPWEKENSKQKSWEHCRCYAVCAFKPAEKKLHLSITSFVSPPHKTWVALLEPKLSTIWKWQELRKAGSEKYEGENPHNPIS